jgi:hypothetical protein
MKCKNCQHFDKSNKVEFSDELMDITGLCNLSGAVIKSKDNCKNGNYQHK